MPIKSGKYGNYYEWTQEGKVYRMSLEIIPDWTPQKSSYSKTKLTLTEDDCAKLVAGEPVICKITTNSGFKELECKISDYKDKTTGETKYAIRATTKQEIYDRDILANAVKSGQFKIVGNTLAKIKENLGEQLKEVPLSLQDKIKSDRNGWYLHIGATEQVIHPTNEIIASFHFSGGDYSRTTFRGGFPKLPFKLLFDEEYRLIQELTEDEYIAKLNIERQYQDELNEKREQEKKAKAEEEYKKWVEEVNKRPWEERTLEDAPIGLGGGTIEENYEDLITRLKEKYPEKDIMKMVLFRYKPYKSYSNPSGRTIESRGWTSYLVKNVLAGVTEMDVCGLVKRGWNEQDITKGSFEGDRDVEYIVTITALPTD